MTKVGVIARADLTGLGIQSRNWVRLLNPHKIIVINSSPFNNNEQHYEWYENHPNWFRIDGFPKRDQIQYILDDIDVLLMFETPYNYEIFSEARKKGVKTVLHANWEFIDYLQRPELPMPDLLVNHSYWNLDKQKELWPEITDYCPTPVFVEDYDEIMLENMDKDLTNRRFLHIAGRKTYKDRNGTQDLINAVRLLPQQCKFELVIKSQTAEFQTNNDPRIIVDTSSPVDEKELYRGFDAMILPRRYAGASLPMNEALMSGLPVIMTDIEPNNQILPKEWLVESRKVDEFMARTTIDVYSADEKSLAYEILDFVNASEETILATKIRAREIAIKEYSSENVKQKWSLLLQKLGV